jgi:hypothetical protein
MPETKKIKETFYEVYPIFNFTLCFEKKHKKFLDEKSFFPMPPGSGLIGFFYNSCQKAPKKLLESYLGQNKNGKRWVNFKLLQ